MNILPAVTFIFYPLLFQEVKMNSHKNLTEEKLMLFSKKKKLELLSKKLNYFLKNLMMSPGT